LGHNLVKANSGKEALEQVLKQDFAAILLDVQMPGLDGFETASLMRGIEKTRHTPIIFITAIYGDDDHAAKGYSVGAVDYLVKPFDPKTMLAKVTVFVDLYKQREETRRQKEMEERRARAELRETEERFRIMADTAPV